MSDTSDHFSASIVFYRYSAGKKTMDKTDFVSYLKDFLKKRGLCPFVTDNQIKEIISDLLKPQLNQPLNECDPQSIPLNTPININLEDFKISLKDFEKIHKASKSKNNYLLSILKSAFPVPLKNITKNSILFYIEPKEPKKPKEQTEKNEFPGFDHGDSEENGTEEQLSDFKQKIILKISEELIRVIAVEVLFCCFSNKYYALVFAEDKEGEKELLELPLRKPFKIFGRQVKAKIYNGKELPKTRPNLVDDMGEKLIKTGSKLFNKGVGILTEFTETIFDKKRRKRKCGSRRHCRWKKTDFF